MIPQRLFSSLNLVFALLIFFPGMVVAQESRKITEISIEGKARVNASLIRGNIKTKVGTVYDEEIVSEDIRMIFRRFRINAEFIRQELSEGDHVIIRLYENIRIRDVSFRGVDSKEQKKLLELIGLDDDAVPDQYQLRSYETSIKAHFRKEGYYFAQVVPLLTPEEDGARLTFDVFKGEKVTVDEIHFIGAEQVDPDDLQSIMTLKEPSLWIFTHKLKDDVLKQDIAKLNDFMKREGYLNARISLDSLDFNDDFDEVIINILVQEKERFFVRNIFVEGCEAFHSEDIKELIHINPDDPYREVKINRDLGRIESFYRDRGYIKSRALGPDLTYDQNLPVVDLTFIIREDEQKVLRDVLITGNTQTKDKVIRREVSLFPGENIKHSEIRWSLYQLKGLQYFIDDKGFPQINVKTIPTDDPHMEDLSVDVGEGGTGLFSFTFGVSTDTGLVGGISINKRNFDISNTPSSLWALPVEFFNNEAFHGGGQNLVLRLSPGTIYQNYRITFFEPYLFDTHPYPVNLSFDMYKTNWARSDFDESRLGLKPVIGKRWSRNFFTSLGLKTEQVDIKRIADDALDDVKRLQGKTGVRALEGHLSYQDTDRPFLPSSGYSLFLNYEYAGGFLGSDVELSKAVTGGTLYIPAFQTETGTKHVLALQGTLGWMEPHSGADEIPYFERFFAGGVSGHFPLRGFKFWEAGPHRQDEPIGGQAAVAMSAEYSIPILSEYDPYMDDEDTRLKGVIFFDMANVAKDIHDSDLMGRLRSAYGVGVKIRLPVLGGFPISLYYGIPLKKYAGDERRSFNINISSFF